MNRAKSHETIPDVEDKTTICEKLKFVIKNVTIEPLMFCYVLPSSMAGLAVQNLSLEKACSVNLGYSNEICSALMAGNQSNETHIEEVNVQVLVAKAQAYKSLIQSIIPTLLLMFAGSWSDRNNRRKPWLLIPVAGEAIGCSFLILCTYYFYELGIEYNVLAEALPPALCGGWFTMYMSTFSYISAVSDEKTRTIRIGAVNMLLNVSFTIGLALSGILFVKIGYYGLFSTSNVLYIIALFYGIFKLKEPRTTAPQQKTTEKKKNFLIDFFDWKHILETFKVAFKKGERNRKKRICSIMILVMVIIGPMHGEFMVNYIFARYKFQWSEMDYSMYTTFNLLAHMCGVMFCLSFFTKYLKMDDALLGMISCTSKIISGFIFAYAPNGFIFYIGAIVEMFNGTSFIAMRSIISKLVPADELGKIYSLFGVSEALMPLAYGPLYTFIYSRTIETFPGAYFIAGSGLTLPAFFIFLWLYFEHKKDAEMDKLNKAVGEKLLTNGTKAEVELETIVEKIIDETDLKD